MRWISFLLLVPALSGCSKNIYDSMRWQSREINIDGQPDEWSIPLQFFDNTTGLNYEVSNNRENLYLAIRVTDRITQQQIISSGLLVEFDTMKTNNYSFAMKFPIRKDARPGIGPGKTHDNNFRGIPESGLNKPGLANEDFDPTTFGAIPDGFLDEMMLKGFNNLPEKKVIVHTGESNGIDVRMKIDENEVMFCEAVVPFNTFYKDYITFRDTLTVIYIHLSIENNPFPTMQDKKSGTASDNYPRGNSPGMNGGFPGSGGPPSGGNNGEPGGMGGPGGMSGPGGSMSRSGDVPSTRNQDKISSVQFSCRPSIREE